MFLKVNQGSLIYGKLFTVLVTEGLRHKNFHKWMRENLPEFNDDVLIQRFPWHIYADVVGWKLTGEVDKKVWRPIKGWEGYYEPNVRTKAGKAMGKRIDEARGNQFNRFEFFDIFGTSLPERSQYTVPNGFVLDGVCYMEFDDANYRDICMEMAGQFEGITPGEWVTAMKAWIEANKKSLNMKKINEIPFQDKNHQRY